MYKVLTGSSRRSFAILSAERQYHSSPDEVVAPSEIWLLTLCLSHLHGNVFEAWKGHLLPPAHCFLVSTCNGSAEKTYPDPGFDIGFLSVLLWGLLLAAPGFLLSLPDGKGVVMLSAGSPGLGRRLAMWQHSR